MKVLDLTLTDECFTHIDDKTGVQTTWAVGRLLKKIEEAKLPFGLVPVEEHHAQFCVTNRGVEQDRLASLVEGGAEIITRPIIFIHLPDDTHMLADGTHRYVLCFAMGIPHIKAYIVEYEFAKEFVVEDAVQTNKETLMQHSGLTTLRKIFGHD